MQKIKDFKDNFVKGRKINYHDLNDILKISKKILKIFLILIFVLSFYICVRVFKELNIIGVILTILSTLKPFFIGIIIAWLFNPIVNYLQKKGIRRVIGTSLSYVALILILFLIIGNIIPLAYEQLKDLSNLLPTILDNAQNLINNIFNHFNSTDLVNIDMVKDKLYNLINNYTNGIYNTLPNTLFGVAKGVISGTGTFLLGMLIGFFLLLGFNNINESLLIFIPKKFHNSTIELFSKITKALRGYVNGALFDATIIFVACSILFFIIGVKSPILFGLFCGIMNIIPYAGPYIGAVPALIVAYSQSMSIGIWATVAIVVVQCLEGNILSPIVMSKTTKLHPVSIIVGLLIFGHFFGIVGMLLSTPIISVLKVVIEFIDSKLHIFNNDTSKITEEE